MSAVREIKVEGGVCDQPMICISQAGLTVRLPESAIKRVIEELSGDLARYQMYMDMLIEHKKGQPNAT